MKNVVKITKNGPPRQSRSKKFENGGEQGKF